MRRWVPVLLAILALGWPAGAAEIELKNGTRLQGELVNEVLLVSTGSDVVEVDPGQVDLLSAEEIRLADGRIIRGTIVGGRLRVRTQLGELAIGVDTLRIFRSDRAVSAAVTPPAPPIVAMPSATDPTPAPASTPAGAKPPEAPPKVREGAAKAGQSIGEAVRGMGRAVVEGADVLHDGIKAFGQAVWGVMKSVGRAARDAF